MSSNNNENLQKQMTGAIMIVGAGISGMQSALDLAEVGYKVYIVEKSPAIGGTMPMLDKTFPTNDCSMCILSPKLVETGRHRNIEIFTLSDVVDLQGEPGNFTVKIRKRPRYVDVTKCLGCGACAEECPEEVACEFDQGIGTRKAIYKPYAQAFPNAYVIDMEHCLECMACEDACPAGAIDHDMEEEMVEVKVGAILLCPGFELFEPELRGEFGYGVYKNVITSLQFERMLSASGPFQGHLKRPSDGETPKKIAFIQCVGSRDVAKNQGYCSAVCCMYATKEAIIAKEHVNDLDTSIFYMDIRAYGKDFEKYYNRAKDDYGVKYKRCMISSVKEIPHNNNLRLRYVNEEKQFIEEDFDMVVLSLGLKPKAEAVELGKKFGLELNEYNFCRLNNLTGVETTRPGIYVAGAFCGPKDIPETVMQASAAAGEASALLASARNTLVKEREFPPERDVSGEEPRIGVFVCHCGINIGSVVDVPAVVEYAKKLPNVVHAQENLYVCSQDTQAAMRDIIVEQKLNRVVVASCSPRTHKPLFQETLREAGINRHLFEMANIRDQCSWVHQKEPELATEKAKDLVKAAVTKAALLEPIEQLKVGVEHTALVIGGGISGMTAALSLAGQGFNVELVEKSEKLGGVALRIKEGLNKEDVQSHLKQTINEINNNPKIKTHLNSEVAETGGYLGNFTTKLTDGTEIKHGATIIATGGEEYKPEEYLYGQDERVMTQLELGEAIEAGDQKIKKAKNIVMIQCVGSREESRPYCSRVCCSKTMRLAIEIKEKKPDANIFVLYRDIRTYGFMEDYYREARAKGVIFIRYEAENKPKVEKEESGRLVVKADDHVLKEQIEIEADIITLAAAIKPSESNARLSQLYKLPLNPDNFFLEAHMKLRPVDFPSEGVYMCGLAHGPKNLEENIAQAKAAAGRAATILSRDKLESKGVIAVVDPEKCASCLTCVRLCPFNAPRINPKTMKAEIEPVQCQGCGTCAGECPNKAIQLLGYKDQQQMAQVEGLFMEVG